MKIIKWLLISLFFVIVLVGAGAAFLISNFDANQYKDQITSAVKKQTGRDIAIDGELELSVYPDISLALGKTTLSNAEGFAGKHFAQVESANVSVELLPLLKKQVTIDEIRLNGLDLNLHRKADGSTNWDDLAKPSEEEKEPVKEETPNEVVTEMMNNLSVAGISLKDAKIHWRDDQGGQDITLNPVNLKTGSFKPGKPLPVELDINLTQKSPAMTVKAEIDSTVTMSEDKQSFSFAKLKLNTVVSGEPLSGGTLTANLTGDVKANAQTQAFSVKGLHLQSELTGELVSGGKLLANVQGNVNGNAKKITIPDLKLNTNLTGNLIPEGAVKTDLVGNLVADLANQKITLNGMKLNSAINGKPLAGGKADVSLSSNLNFDMAAQLLNLPGLVVDATLQGGHIKDGTANTKITGSPSVNLGKTSVSMPNLDINTNVKGGIVPGETLSQQAKGAVNLNWGSGAGQIDLASLAVKLADLQLTGSNVQIQPLAEKPSVKGNFQTNTFNLKSLLKTLGIEPPVTANPAAMTSTQASFALDANTEKATLNNLALTLDKSKIKGSLGVADFTAPAIRPTLTIDSINLDDYLAPTSDAPASATTAQTSGGNAELLPMETLRGLDIDGSLKIGNIIINKLKLSNIVANIKADKGLVTIDPANASLYKGNYTGKITLDARQATPTMQMKHELAGLRSEGLLFDLFADKYVSGDTKVITEMSSKGNSIDAILANLNGTTSMSFTDGTIRDSSLAEKVSLAVNAFEKKAVEGDKTVVTFTGLSGDWKTTNGVFDTQNLTIESPYFNISGKGFANIAKQELDMKLRIASSDKDNQDIFAPLRVYGTFSDLKFSLQLDELVKSLAKKDLAEAKEKAKQKLKEQEERIKQKLEAEKQALTAKLQKEKAAQEAKLRQKLQAEKDRQMQNLKEKVGEDMTNKLKASLGGSATTEATEDIKKDLEEKAKDKLKEGLRGLF
ncbi:MAG: AsmA family protein [uncultured Thiotrichaceae bacterium]|uniref:AsmA family protein n=1 Tax=uncultured Thiotrichaceae bacterium TaxID=298394 RepID=A0A6S6SMF3_9GAMM|nr:MAG: AsmA family protein [uncultured Thiotrichaceae bacterium]